MQVRITLRNYRCFTENAPAVFEIGKGFTSFIGPNNAGKSTVLRFFYEMRNVLRRLIAAGEGTNIRDMFPDSFVGLGGLPAPITDQTEIVNEYAKSPLQFTLEVPHATDFSPLFIRSATWTYDSLQQAWKIDLVSSEDQHLHHQKNGETFGSIRNKNISMSNGRVVEFQTLVTAVSALVDIQYLGPFRNAVNEGAGSYYDLHLGTAFLEQWHYWKTGGNKAQNRAIGKVTDDIRRLIGATTLEINASNELKTLQLVIDGRPHKLSELGAGIAQLVVVLGNALIRSPSFIAIDEPETHLHPSLQLDFLTTLASYAKHGVLYSTHSLGLARSSSDRMYSVQSTSKGSIVRAYERTPRYAEFLGSMGIAGLEEIGWSKILLVEGPSDVRTFQQLLRKYGKDRQVVILPLGGSSMINGKTTPLLAEIVRMCPDVSAIVDSEKKSPNDPIAKDRIEFSNNCAQLKIKCLVTQKRATENYLSARCLNEVFGDPFVALGDYGLPTAENTFWGKSENWRAAQNMTVEELEMTDIGKFLREL